MATNVGEAVIKLSFDDKDSATKLQDAFKNVGKIAGTAGKFIVGGIGAAATAVTSLATASVKTYAEYEQLQGGVETLFKDSADTIMEYSQQAYKTAGLSSAEYMEQATSFASRLIRDTGGDTQRAAELVDLAIRDMSDNANKMGTDIESIQHAYEGLSKGNATMLDNLKVGYGGTQTEMLKLAKDMGVVDESVQSFNDISFEDAILAIHEVQDRLGITGTTAEEAEQTISGSFNMMKTSAQDLITGLANPEADIEQLIDNLFDSVLAFGDNLIPAISTALKGISKFIEKAVPKLLQVIPDPLKETLPNIITLAVELFGTILNEIPTITQTLIDTFFEVVQMLIPQIPTIFTAVINGILGFLQTLSNPANLQLLLQTALQLLMAIVQAVPQIIQALSVALPDIISNLVAFFLDPNNIMLIMEAAMQLFLGIVQAVPQIFGALFQAFGNLFGSLWQKLQGMFTQFFGNFGETVKRIFVTAVNGVLQFIENFINGPIDTINGFIDIINSTFGSVGVNLGKINRLKLPRMAQGGVVDSATAALIGEAGKEAVIPLERNTENWTAPLAKALAEQFESEGISTAGHITVNMNNYINNNLDADEIGQRLMTSIRRAA